MSVFVHRENKPRFGFDIQMEDLLWPLTITSAVKVSPRYSHHDIHNKIIRKRKREDGFDINVDVQHFKPEEITVKVVDNIVVVQCQHEERQDEHGFVSRQFRRKYMIPEGFDINEVESTLSLDGVLTLTAPKLKAIRNGERIIPIIHTGPIIQQNKNNSKQIKVEEVPINKK